MPELQNRDALESDFIQKFGRVARRHMHEFRELLGDPPDLTNVPQEFWDKMEKESEREFYPLLLLLFTESATQHGWTGTDMAMTAFGWAVIRSAELAQHWVESTRERFASGLQKLQLEASNQVASTVDEAIDIGSVFPSEQQIDDEKFRALLDKLFGPQRIESTAVNEVTRARHAGGEAAIDATVGISEEDLWMTEDDRKVCPICSPMHRKPRSYWARFFPGGPPDPHSKCRCFIAYANQLAGAASE